MSAQVVEAVPNFSEGRDLSLAAEIVEAMAAMGAEVLDWSADPDHHRMVVTLVGAPAEVEASVMAGAALAVARIDLRKHTGVHPRIGALDVLPFVPLLGLGMEDARALARRVGRRLADELELPVFFYGRASDPPGRNLAEVRRGGFEELVRAWPADRQPDLLPRDWPYDGAHPRAGAVCVGVRGLLLAWNVLLSGVGVEQARAIAAAIRERDGGMAGVRALAFELPMRGGIQISMNLEDLEATSPLDVFRRIETLVAEHGGEIIETEIIGMAPDELLLTATADRLRASVDPRRLLSRRLAQHLAGRAGGMQARDH